jgi:hypothetical protein
MIRRHARPGEWVIAFAKKAESNGNPLVKYVMGVEDNPSFDGYCRAWAGKRRDAIYRFDGSHNGDWFDNGYSDHNPCEKDDGPRDKSGRNVLISSKFVHFGIKPRNLILELTPICESKGLDAADIVDKLWHRGIGQSKYCSPEAYTILSEWFTGLTLDKGTPLHHPQFPKRPVHRTVTSRCG